MELLLVIGGGNMIINIIQGLLIENPVELNNVIIEIQQRLVGANCLHGYSKAILTRSVRVSNRRYWELRGYDKMSKGLKSLFKREVYGTRDTMLELLHNNGFMLEEEYQQIRWNIKIKYGRYRYDRG